MKSTSISGMLTPSHLLGQKVKSRWPVVEGNFARQFQSFFAVLYVSSTPLHDFNLQFQVGSASKTFKTMEKVHKQIITGPVYIFECLKRFDIAVWPKNCPKLFKNGKMTVKK